MYCVVGAKQATRIEYVMDVNKTAAGKKFIAFNSFAQTPTLHNGLRKASVYAFRTSFFWKI